MNVRPNFTIRGASNIQEIHTGDVIRYKYWGLSHEGVVVADSRNKGQKGRLRVIHYGTDSLIAYREIKEENIEFDLSNEHVQVISFTCETLETEIVIKRARSRIGEQRHSIFANKSCHFVEWSKVGMIPISQCTTSHGILNLFNVYTWDEMQVGCIVEFPYYKLNHQGVLTSFDEKKRVITVIHYGTKGIFARRTIMKETLHINLKKDSLKLRCIVALHLMNQMTQVLSLRMLRSELASKTGNQETDRGTSVCNAYLVDPVCRPGQDFATVFTINIGRSL